MFYITYIIFISYIDIIYFIYIIYYVYTFIFARIYMHLSTCTYLHAPYFLYPILLPCIGMCVLQAAFR